MFGKEEQKISDLLKSIVKDNRQLDQRLAGDRVVKAWEELFGANFEQYVDGVQYRGNILYLSLNSSVLRQELHLSKQKIVLRLNEAIGEELIKDICLK
jgi:hypothetical protein